MSKKRWTDRFSFIITTSAFAVGLGNIWRFPYIAGEGGGGAFLLVYIVLIFLIGIPLLTIEIGLGRLSQTTPLLGYAKLSKHKIWNILGWLEVLANLMIMMYYVMIMAWIAIYFKESFAGNLGLLKQSELSEHFRVITSNFGIVVLTIFVIMTAAIIILRQGLHSGLEKYSKFMMIALFGMLVGLAIWSFSLDGGDAGYRWFLYPDFSKINFDVIIAALGQLFFSIGVGMAVAFAFGSYTSKKENLIQSTAYIVFADTFIAVLAGLMIFPIIFSSGLQPDSGPDLIFITMASVFGKIEFGRWLGSAFFLTLFIAGFTSLISSLQALKDSFGDRFLWSDSFSLKFASIVITIGALPIVYSYSNTSMNIFGMSVFNFMDYLTNSVMLPLGGLFIVIFAAYVIGFEQLKAHLQLNNENIKIHWLWNPIIKWIIPIALMIILIRGLWG